MWGWRVQQLFQGAYWLIDFYHPFFCSIMPSRGCQTHWFGQCLVCTCVLSARFLIQGAVNCTQRHRSLSSKMCDWTTFRSLRTVGQNATNNEWLNQTHTVEGIQIPIVSWSSSNQTQSSKLQTMEKSCLDLKGAPSGPFLFMDLVRSSKINIYMFIYKNICFQLHFYCIEMFNFVRNTLTQLQLCNA